MQNKTTAYLYAWRARFPTLQTEMSNVIIPNNFARHFKNAWKADKILAKIIHGEFVHYEYDGFDGSKEKMSCLFFIFFL